MTLEERMGKGYLWWDTEEYLENQARVRDLAYEFNHSRPSEKQQRTELLKQMFHHVGENVFVAQPLTLANGRGVTIGEGTYINSNLTLIDDYKITIGKNCLFAPNVTITTTGHPVHPDLRSMGMYSFPVEIKDNVWLGCNVVIHPGVTIGENSVIGSGSVVTKDIPANVIAAGVPCKVIREITDRDKEYYYHDLKVADLPQE